MDQLLCQLINIYVILLIGRIILSWFPLGPDSPMAVVHSFLYTVTEPVLGPLRRAMPPLGGLDLSPIVVFIGLRVVQGAIC